MKYPRRTGIYDDFKITGGHRGNYTKYALVYLTSLKAAAFPKKAARAKKPLPP
jgi:hypothetical protein